ncbi:hypothetical protein NHQ30_007114 [Ciborinia camelliae]|nr:hypothetical protein NHQ30_007114 [Ciborinia camelliae]
MHFLERFKTTPRIRSALITLVLSGVKVLGLAPEHRLGQDPQELSVEINRGVTGNIGVEQFAQCVLSGHRYNKTKKATIKYASETGWTQHYPQNWTQYHRRNGSKTTCSRKVERG